MGNYDLLTSDENFLIKLKNEFQDDKKNMGNTVVTTLDADLQEAAYQALGDKRCGRSYGTKDRKDPLPWYPSRISIRMQWKRTGTA